MRATVSIVIVNWNSGSMLRKCLRHCERQTIVADRIFVVDNASQDGSAEGLHHYSGVTLLRMSTNLGFAAANNRAIALCDSEYVVLLNPDAFPDAGWLEALLRAAVVNPRIAAFGSRQMQYGAEDVLDGTGDQYFITGQIRRAGYQKKCTAAHLAAHEIFSPCAAAAMYKLDALNECGGFDEDFFCYAEDVDLGFRLRLRGYIAWYVPEAVVHHMGSAATGGQHSDFATYYGHRNVIWVFVKNMPGLLFWLLLPLHIALNLASLILLAMRGQFIVGVRAKTDAMRGVGLMWKKRKQIAKSTQVSAGEILEQMKWPKFQAVFNSRD
jgi:GT2 family glycosyltransferase